MARVAAAARCRCLGLKGTDPDMTDEHAKGTVSEAQGKVEEGLGTLTGNRRQEATGKARQLKGAGQKALGDVQDAVQKPPPKR
jgi:uncharacterized protein YjbJ (UPF0337 family)